MTLAYVVVAWLLTYLVHSTLLLGGAWVLVAAGVVRSPAAKDTLWKTCLLGGLLTATVQAGWRQPFHREILLPAAAAAPARAASAGPGAVLASRAVFAVPAAQPTAGASRAPRHAVSGLAGATPAAAGPAPHSLRPADASSWPLVLLAAWALVAAALLLRAIALRRRFYRRVGARRPLTGGALVETLESLSRAAGLRRRVLLSVSTELAGPVAMGRSEICLPERVLTSLAPAEQRAVLAHELAHLVRGDPGWLAVSAAIESVLFVQPLNRLARLRMQAAAEYLCDDWAVSLTGGDGGVSLARCLAEVASWMQARSPVPVSGMALSRSLLVARVQRLLDGAEPAAVRGVRLAVPVAALALATVAFAAPGVLPPRPAGGPPVAGRAVSAVAPVPAAPARALAAQGDTAAWATIRDGARLVFRPGYSARISGRGRLGIRRGGRAIEVVDDQQLLVDGRPAGDGDVAVHAADTVRIADAGGHTVWTLTPVRVPVAAGAAVGGEEEETLAGVDAATPRLDSLEGRLDSLARALGALDAIDTAELGREMAHLGTRLGRDIEASIGPQVAELKDLGARIGAAVAPRVAEVGAEMGARIMEQVGPIIAAAFGDSAACDSADSAAPRKAVPHKAAPRRR